MFCKHCGKEIADTSKFCIACGAKVETFVQSGQISQSEV